MKHGGVGHHILALLETAPGKLSYWGRTCLVAVPILYVVASTLPKLVILAVYLRIFVDKWSRIACYAIGAILTSACVINICLSIWQCSPVAFAWDKTIPGGHCRNDVQAHIRWGSFPNIITDVVMLILPLPVIWKLNTSTRNKAGLTITFLTGSM